MHQFDTLFGNHAKPTYNQKMMESDKKEAPNRIIGILGGMGPEATLDLYRHIISLTPASRDQDHIQVLIYSNPKIPDRTKAITAGGENPLPYLREAAKLLEKGGAGIIAMPCNAAHHYLSEVRQTIHVPFLDMIEQTSRELRKCMPLLGPTLLTAAVLRSVDLLRFFDLVFIATRGGPGNASTTMNMYAYQQGFEFSRFGWASASMITLSLVVLCTVVVFARLRRAVSW